MSHIDMIHFHLTRNDHRAPRKVRKNAVSTLQRKPLMDLAQHLNDYCRYHQTAGAWHFTFSKGPSGDIGLSREAREVFGWGWKKYNWLTKAEYIAIAQWIYAQPSIRDNA